MKILSFCSVLVVAGTLSTSALAAGYVQNSNIQEKIFEKVVGDSGCEIETRVYDGDGAETRVRSSNIGSSKCYTISFFADKTATTHILSSYEYGGREVQYSPGLPIIVEDMSLNSSWNQDTDIIVGGSIAETRADSFEITETGSVTVAGGATFFPSCAKVEWDIVNEDSSIDNINLWLCDGMGLVKWEDVTNSETWELQSFVNDGSLTIIDGSEYIQSSSINKKVFVDTYAAGDGWDKESRAFSGSSETRVYSNSGGADIQDATYIIGSMKTDSSYTLVSQEFSSYDLGYLIGIPVLVANMAVGESWEQLSAITDGNSTVGVRNDKFSLQSIKNLRAAGVDYEQCLNILWNSDESYFNRIDEINLWICPDVGLVKYTKLGENWELQSMSYSSSANVGGSDSSGSSGSGGGTLPLSMLVILGIIGIAVRIK